MTALDRLRAALESHGCTITGSGERFTAQCPAHPDNSPSLSITGIDGQVLLYCHAGCETPDVLSTLGLTLGDLFDNPKGVEYRYPGGRIVHRTPDKRFHQTGNTKDRNLYRADRLPAAIAAGHQVHVVEGEKDVHAIEAAGGVATCSPMGAGKWNTVDPSPLRGAHVVVVADNDEPGRRHAATVAASLTGIAADVRIVHAQGGKDAADHIAAGYRLDQFIAAPPAQAAQTPAEMFAADVEHEAHRLRVATEARNVVQAEREPPAGPFDAGLLSEILSRPPAPPFRITGLIPSDAATLIAAQRKTGKTTLLLNLARSLLTGEDFLGRFTVRPLSGRVGFLNYEVSAAQLGRWAADVGVPDDRLFIVNLRGRRNPLSHPADRAQLAALLKKQQAETLIVDPFSRAYTGTSQNDSGEVQAWLSDLDRFARAEVGAADLILTAHAGWEGERTRGASALEDNADTVITLVWGKDDDKDSRYLRALGRDVEIDEDRLDYEQATRRVMLSGHGSRVQATKKRRAAELADAVLGIVRQSPGINGTAVEKALRDAGVAAQKGDGRSTLAELVDAGRLEFQPGLRGAKQYRISDLPRPTPTHPAGDVVTYPDPTLRGGVGKQVTSTPDLPRATSTPEAQTDQRECKVCTRTGGLDLLGVCDTDDSDHRFARDRVYRPAYLAAGAR